MKTDYDTENQTFEIQKPKPNRTTEKTEISVRYGSVRFSVSGKNVPTPTRTNHPVRRLSVGPYDGRRFQPGSEPRLPSPSTRGRQGRNCGLWTTGWPASWVEWTMTTSSSATSLLEICPRDNHRDEHISLYPWYIYCLIEYPWKAPCID
jgi:hypothetical protein